MCFEDARFGWLWFLIVFLICVEWCERTVEGGLLIEFFVSMIEKVENNKCSNLKKKIK